MKKLVRHKDVFAHTERELLETLEYIKKRIKKRDEYANDVLDMDSIIEDYECGTTCCLAGWRVVKRMEELNLTIEHCLDECENDGGVLTIAMILFRIDKKVANVLFFAFEWPEKFQKKYYNAYSDTQRFNALKGRIYHFIEHGN